MVKKKANKANASYKLKEANKQYSKWTNYQMREQLSILKKSHVRQNQKG